MWKTVPIKSLTNEHSSRRSFAIVLRLAQILGLTTFFSIFQTFSCFCVLFLSAFQLYRNKYSFELIVRLLYYSNSFLVSIMYMQMTKKIPSILHEFEKVDAAMCKNYGYPQTLEKRIKITTIVALFYSYGESMLLIGYNLYAVGKHTPDGLTIEAKRYFVQTFSQFFALISYSTWLAAYCQYIYILCSLKWMFNNFFMVIISTVLATRFKQITTRLQIAAKKNIDFWKEVREDYDRLCQLANILDDTMSSTVLLSFTFNLVLVLVYLYNCTIVDEFNAKKAYNVSAFAVLTSRIILVSLYTAWMNDESRAPINVLNCIPTSQYNTEIQRFQLQLDFDVVAFTGKRMFKITRAIVFNICGIILTYELVLVQLLNN